MIKSTVGNKMRFICAGFSALLLMAVFWSGVPVSAYEITGGGGAYINIKNFCVEGKSEAVGSKDGAYTYKRLNGDFAELRMMYLSDTNSGTPIKTALGTTIWAYCIEFGQDINSSDKRVAKDLAASAYWNSLNAETREAVNLAAAYGFPSSDLGVSAADAYAATQAVIWEFQTGIRSLSGGNRKSSVTYNDKFVVSTRFSSMFEDGLKDRAGKAAYELLLDEIYSHSIKPDFGMDEAVLEFDDAKGVYTLISEDKNGVLKKYNVTSSDKKLKARSVGNRLVLECEEEFEGAKLTFSKKLPTVCGQTALILESGGVGQVTYIGSTPCEVTCTLPVSVKVRPVPTTQPTTTQPETTTEIETTTETETTTEIETTTVVITEETPQTDVQPPVDTSDGTEVGVALTVASASLAGFIILNKGRKC